MPNPHSTSEQVIVKMILGPRTGKVAEQDKAIVREKYGELIGRITKMLPNPTNKRSWGMALYAVTVKAFLLYGTEKGEAFVDSYKGNFNGENDPAFGLWPICYGKRGDINSIYRRCVTAIRAHCTGKKLKGIREAKEDIFDWEEGFEVPTKATRKVSDKARAASKASARRPRDDMGNFLPGQWDSEDKTIFVCDDGRRIKIADIDLDEEGTAELTKLILKLRDKKSMSWEKISWAVDAWFCNRDKTLAKGTRGNRKWGPKRCKNLYADTKKAQGEQYFARLGPKTDGVAKDIAASRETIRRQLRKQNIDNFYNAQEQLWKATPEWSEIEEKHID